ncbi:MAG TPA: VOC family protein [Actinopolymorphaceae bacterium]
MTVSTDDVDALVDRLRPAGKGVRIEPVDEDYGVRIASVHDPDGHEVWISGPLKNSRQDD